MLILFTASIVFAQGSEKSEKARLYEKFRGLVQKMEEAYDDGDLNRVIELYNKNCRKDKSAKPGEEKKEFKKLKKEIRATIYQWVALSYIALDRPELADTYLKKLLVIRHDEGIGDYWLPIRNIAKNKYYVAPRWLVGIKGGTNFTVTYPGDRFDTLTPAFDPPEGAYQKDYVFNLTHSRGTQAGIIVEYALTKNLSACVQPTIGSLRFQYKNNFEWQGEDGSEAITGEFVHNQRLKYIEIPVLIRYRFLKAKLKAYAQIGGFYRIMTVTNKSIDATIREGDFKAKEQVRGINIEKQITRSNIGLLVGAAVGYDTGRVRLELEGNYKISFNNIVNGNQRFGNDELIFGYYDIFDDIKIRNWELSLNLLLPVSFKAFRR